MLLRPQLCPPQHCLNPQNVITGIALYANPKFDETQKKKNSRRGFSDYSHRSLLVLQCSVPLASFQKTVAAFTTVNFE